MPKANDIEFEEARLVDGNGDSMEIHERCTLGRHPNNAVVLDSNRVSRWHAAIVRLSLDEYRLMDLDTKNGTILNGHRIAEPARLHDGDSIRIEDYELKFRFNSARARLHPESLESTVGDTASLGPNQDNYEALGHGITVLGPDYSVLAVTESVRQWLWRYFPEFDGDVNALPPEIDGWMREHLNEDHTLGSSAIRSVFKRQRGDRRLMVRIKLDYENRQTLLLFSEEEPLFTLESLHRELHSACELTGREADVVYYLALGKTNPEISMILEIAERTVQKHLENAFPKLGVENRQSAIVFIFDFFKRLHAENLE